jgi:hypothetical protein
MKKISVFPVLTATLIAIFAGTAFAVPGKIIESIQAPSTCPTGLAFDGKGFWLLDRKTDLVYNIDMKGNILKKFETPGYMPSGLAWDGKFLWISDLEEGKIHKLDPKTGRSVKIIDSPSPRPIGLAWDGKNLWSVDDKEKKIYRIDQNDGTILASFKAPADTSTGLAYDGRYLWVADRKEDRIFVVSPEHENVIFGFKAPGKYAWGLAFDGKYLWNVDYQDKKIYKLVHDDGESLEKSDNKKERLEVTSFIMNYGPSELKELRAYLADPVDGNNQKLLSPVSYSPKPKMSLLDQYGQKFFMFEFLNLKPTSKVEIKMSVDAELNTEAHYIYPHKVGGLSKIPADIQKIYLSDSAKYDIKNEYIQKKVKEIVGNEKNPYWIARKLYNWEIANMEYKLAGGWETAPQVLKRGFGSCSEYTFSYLSLTRAAGIPSRYVGSYVVRGDDASFDDVFHRWAEIYLPGYGWVPIDANAGDKEEPFKQAQFFGGIENRFVITTRGGGDSKYMDWGYNLREEWVAEGKAKVRVEDVAEWTPLNPPPSK